MISSYEAFLEGRKPATYVNLGIISRPELISKLMKYPKINEFGDFWMFFRNDRMKSRYMKQMNGIKPGTPERQYILGITLGYPPKAVDFYTRYFEWQLREREVAKDWFFTHNVAMKYHGIMFVSHVDDLEENARWLWDTYQIDEEICIEAIKMPERENERFIVQFRNLSDITDVREKAKQVLKYNSLTLHGMS